MSDWTRVPNDRATDSAEVAAREAQHRLLIDLLGAYADRELPPETMSQIDAHLVGCGRCRRELAVHRAVRERLGVEPPVAAPPALRERIAAAIAATPLPAATPPNVSPGMVSRRGTRTLLWIAAGALTLVIGVAALAYRRVPATTPALGALSVQPASVPLLRDVVADYRRVTAGDLPGRARDLDAVRSAVAFPVEPLRAPGLRLLASWTSDVGGEAAAVLAYRWSDRIVLEYVVSEARFFQHPAIRSAVTDGRMLAATDGAQGILAWPTPAAGVVLVGDLPPDRLAMISTFTLARTHARDAQ